MADLFEYLTWRGDLPFSQVPLNAVDALIFSAVSYLRFDGIVPQGHDKSIPLTQVAKQFLALPDAEEKVRNKNDLVLLERLTQTHRFASVGLTGYSSQFIPEEDTQFAAVTFLLDPHTVFLAYRGTDSTVVGWKEDFCMSFEPSVPAQRKALAYLEQAAGYYAGPLLLGGHSKGGNLAVFAAAMAAPEIQARIHAVYNNDGPGFTDFVLNSPGYHTMLPKIHTFVPQSSIIGMLLEHDDPYTIIRSRQVSILQHELYSWEVLGGDFIQVDQATASSQFINQTIKSWLKSMSMEERSAFVEALFDLVETGDADHTAEIMHPHNIYAYLRTLTTDETTRRLLAGELGNLLRLANETLRKSNQQDDSTNTLPETIAQRIRELGNLGKNGR